MNEFAALYAKWRTENEAEISQQVESLLKAAYFAGAAAGIQALNDELKRGRQSND